MTQDKQEDVELREQLAAIEHERWSDWQRYLHSKLKAIRTTIHEVPIDGMLMSPSDYHHWEEQIAADYSELSDAEKKSDMEQVDRYWKLVQRYTEQRVLDARIEELEHIWLSMDNAIATDFECGGDWEYSTKEDRLAQLRAQRQSLEDRAA